RREGERLHPAPAGRARRAAGGRGGLSGDGDGGGAVTAATPTTAAETPAPRILLVEDEPSLVLTLTDRLVAEGYRVETAGDGNTALARAGEEPFDLVVLDVMLPGKNGFDICRDLRQRGVSTPVLMLTARTQVTDRVVGLKLGADDYLTKPFEMIELLARIEALLRRSRGSLAAAGGGGGGAGAYTFGDVAVDFRRAEVT